MRFVTLVKCKVTTIAAYVAVMFLCIPNISALKTTNIIEPGDKLSFMFPVANSTGNMDDLTNLRLEIVSAPAWLKLSENSVKGPINLPPGEKMIYRLDYEVGAEYSQEMQTAELVVEVKSAVAGLHAARFVWHLRTSNGFLTYSSECLDEEGNSFGGTLSPDKYSPRSSYHFSGPSYSGIDGTTYVSAQTGVIIEGDDVFVEDAVASEVSFTGYKPDPSSFPSDIGQLTPYDQTVLITVPGPHTIVYASKDNAGNVEPFKSLSLFVDNAAPGPATNLKANGATPSPWTNAKTFDLTWASPSDVSGVAGARIKLGGAVPVNNNEGIFFIGPEAVTYPVPDIVNGLNVIWLWLEDNVANADPSTAGQLTLRYDDIRPGSSASSPQYSKVNIVPVSFTAFDDGAPDTGSGAKQTVLWYRNNSGEWKTGGYASTGVGGSFNFDTQGTEGIWEFYTQSTDNAGNSEPPPDTATPAKAKTLVDITAPVISGIKVTVLSPSSALLEWTTDDETTAVVDYGQNETFGLTLNEPAVAKAHSVTLTGLVNPADIYYRITATNKTGLNSASQTSSFKTPLDIRYATDIFGVIDYTQPVSLCVTNPNVTEATFVVDGINRSGPVKPGEPFQATINPAVTGGGTFAMNISAGGYQHTSSFIVDNAVRTVKLARLVVSDGGVINPPSSTKSGLEATSGQTVQADMASADSKLYLGYYAGIDPVPPAAVSELRATAGPKAGQMSLSWPAPGDDGNVGTAMKYELRYSPDPITAENFNSAVLAPNIPLPEKAGSAQALVISGLENGKVYYFTLKAFDELLNYSLSNLASQKTLQVALSEAYVGDDTTKRVLEVVSPYAGVVIEPGKQGLDVPEVEVAYESGQAPIGLIFDITPSMVFPEGETAQLNFRYPELNDDALEQTLKVWKYDTTLAQWVPLTGTVDSKENIIHAVTHSFSLYGVFEKDNAPPVTSAVIDGNSKYTDSAGNIYISGVAGVILESTDSVSGVARIEYRLDSSTGSFTVYSGPVQMPEGWHTLQYRSVDKGGNMEQTKSLFVMRDALAPHVELNFDGEFSRLPGGVIHISSATGGLEIVTLDQPSSGSGLKSVRLEFDGVASDISSQHSISLVMGRHDVVVRAEDNVGNVTEQRTEVVVGDLLPPVISAPANNFAASQSTITFSWQHQTTNFFSLTEYDLMIGAEPGFATPEFTQVVSSHVKVTLLISEAGVTVEGLEAYGGALRLVTEQMPDQWTGALEGVMVTPNISLPPNTTGISNFTVTQSTNAGSIDHEYKFQVYPFAASSYYPIVPGGGRDFDMTSGGWVAFRSTLRRNALTEASPTLTKIEFTVNYVVVNWQRVCYKPCWGCSYICNYQAVTTPYNYQTGIPGVSAVSHEGLSISSSGALELLTEPGALTGIWLSQAYPVPDTAYRIGDLQPDYDSNGGLISFEFSKSSGAFSPIAELESVNFRTGDTIQFKATLSRFTSNDNSPVFRGINFNFIAPPPTGTEFSLPVERKYYWRVAAKDYLGRYSAPSVERLIIYDTKPPLTEHLLNGATGQGGWLVSPVSVTLVSTDAVAGVGGIYYSVDGSSFAQYASPFLMAEEGARVLRYYSADTVGNKEAEKSFTAKIDLSSPAITAAISPAANAYGWNNAPVGVVFTGSDTVSGLAYCSSSATVSGEGAGREVRGECYDNAGLASTAAVVVSIDATAPTIQYTRSPAANDFGWNSSTVTVKFACADALSGVRVCPPDLALAAEGANTPTAAVALDFAGNSSSIVPEGIRIDRTPPASGASLAGTFKNGWYSTPVAVTLVSTDSLSGVSQAIYSQDEAAFAAYQQPVSVTVDGAHTIKYNASDKAGNAEPQKSVTFSIDGTGPQVSYVVVPAPNAYGWNNGSLTVLYIGTDTLSGVDICPARGVAAEGVGQNVAGWCRDRAGNVAYSTAIVNVDLSSPTVRAIQNPVPNEAGWNNGPVTVIFSGEDSLSGIAGCAADKVVSLEGAGQGATGSCSDRAGNTSYSTRYVSIDKTAPLSSATLSGTMNNGWYNSGVLITISSTDTLSGVGQVYYRLERAGVLVSSGNYTGPVLAGTDGLYAAYYYGVDRAGNAETEKSAVFGIDRTTPQVNYTLSPPPNAAGWNNTAVQLVFSGTDTLSGITECSSATVSTAGLARAVAGWCRDVAGNIGYATATLNIDLTAPVVTATQAPPRNSYGWNNSTVTVAFSGADDISAVSYCTPGITVAAEASGQVVSGYCSNYAGLSSTASLTVNIDRSFPLSRLFLDGVIVATGSANLYMRPGSSLTIVSGEPPITSQSGVAFATFTVTQYAPTGWNTIAGGIYSDPLVPQQEGLYMLYYNSIDKADNWEPQRKRQVYVDTTAPVTTPYMDGVKVTSSTIMFVRPGTAISLVATDPLSNGAASGVDFTTYTITRFITPDWVVVDSGTYTGPLAVNGEEGHYMFYFQSRDKSGNWEPKRRREGYLDVTPPAIAISSPPAGKVFVATRGKINIGFGVTDNLDPAPGFSAFLEQVMDKGSPRGSRPVKIAVVNGQAIEPLDIDDGIWQLTVSATDFASNSATVAGGTFEVVHDMLPPRTTRTVSGGPLYESGNSLYIRKDTVLTLTSADDLVQAADGAGLGVKSQSASIPGRDWVFMNPNPRQGQVYVSTLALDGQADGSYSLHYSALDVLGNAEAVKISTLIVDNTAPELSSRLDGIAGENGWHISTVTVSLSAIDALSGVADIFYRLDGADGAAFARYPGSFTVAAEGQHTGLFYAVDNLGNTSEQQSRSFRIDWTVPVVTKTIAPEANQDGWHNGAVTVSFAGSDAVSGVAYCDPARTTRVEGRDTEVSGYCRDYAGLSSTVTARFSVDLTSPTISIERSPEANAYGWNNTDITAKFICSDALSGIKYCPAEKVFSSEGTGQGVSGAVGDYAGNTAATSISGINIDKTAPETALAVVGDFWESAGKKYLSLRSGILLSAVDPVSGGVASGVEDIEYSIDSSQFQVYSSSFSLAEGLRVVGFRARDKAGNIEAAETSGVYVDGTPPETTHHIGVPYYASGGVNYITPVTPLTFTAADPVASAAASGVKRIEVAVDGGAFGDYTAALTLPEGRHTIKYRAIDNVGNTEAEKTLEVQSDKTPPVSAWLASSGETITLGGKFYLNALGSVALQSEDPAAAGVASGVEGIYYGIDAVPASRYAAPFGLAEGIRNVSFYAKDNVGNAEVVKSTVVHVDGTAPVSALSESGDQYHGGQVYISTRSLVVITAQDPVAAGVASGVRETKYSVDGGTFAGYSAFGLPVEGKHVVAYYSTDQVGNIEAAKTAELWVDATPPVTALSIDGARHDADGLIYITKDSGVVLTPADPVSAGTASGVMLTKYRVDGGNWQVYSGSFTITAEGRHTLEYYSLDRVQNAEALKSAALAVDNTPPAAAVSLGEPKFTAFGLPVLSPDAPITLAAADVVSGGVVSGLRQIYYEVVNVASGVSARYNYVEPFKLSQGTYDLRYWSVDNVANVEAYKQVRFAVSTFQNDSLQTAGGLDMSGTADIAGAVRSNAVVSVSGNARILGDVAASTITLSGRAQITGQQTSGAAPLSPEPVYLGAIPDIPVSTVPAGYLIAGRLVVNSQAKLTLSTGTYRFTGIELAGGSEISVNGKVDILVSGDVRIGGGSSLNAAGLASDLNIFVNSASTLSFTGGGNLVAKVYAPKAHLKLAGNAVLGGHYFARTAAVSGTGNILQAGETLPKTSATAWDGGTGKKKASAFAAESYSVLSGPDPAFRLGEIYVFPNPAKGGEAPVFHVETGLADSVKITVYTVSGRQAHETQLTGMPAALDDGNGLSYAYEYTWRGYIPSGVYYYHIEAEKSGQKLKKSGKFAVVR